MPLRGYITPYDIETDAEGMQLYVPRIGATGNPGYSLAWSAFDLRTAEQQGQNPAQGYALVLIDATGGVQNQIKQLPDTHEVTLSTTPAEVVAIIGAEATEHLLDPSTFDTIVDWFRAVHAKRVGRWKGR